MIRLDSISRKREVPDVLEPETGTVVDIAQGVFLFNDFSTYERTVLITDDFVMRPDLVARDVMGEQGKLDHLLVYNGIDNPFCLDSGMVLAVPDKDRTGETLRTEPEEQKGENNPQQKLLNPDRMSKKDQKRLDYVKQLSAATQNGSVGNLPPNFAEPGAQEITVKDGKVVFGGDVAGNADHCIPKSRAKVKAKLIEQKTFGKRK